MMIVNDDYHEWHLFINVSMSLINNYRRINYKNITIVNETTRVVRMTPQLGASLTDDSRSVIYNRNMFLIQVTVL
jgi:hypothetical protein